MKRLLNIAFLLGLTTGLGVAALPAQAFQLITQAEAALPAAPTPDIGLRGLTRGPDVDQRSPSPEAVTPLGPLTLDVTFEPHNGVAVDPGTVKVTYLKEPAIDLTQRLKPYITATGIKAGDVGIPPGTHMIRIDLADTQGRTATKIMTIKVAGN